MDCYCRLMEPTATWPCVIPTIGSTSAPTTLLCRTTRSVDPLHAASQFWLVDASACTDTAAYVGVCRPNFGCPAWISLLHSCSLYYKELSITYMLVQNAGSGERWTTQIPFYTNVCAVTADSSSRALICGTVPVAFPARIHRPASVMLHPARRLFDQNGRRLHSPHSTCPGCLQPAVVGSTGPCQYAPLSHFSTA
eukprot:COSAG01_NODE_13005_length_1650_cov_1.842037_1_plen_195_part_00